MVSDAQGQVIDAALRQGEIPVCRIQPQAWLQDSAALSDDERAAATGRQPTRRQAFVACRSVVRVILGWRLGCLPEHVPIIVTDDGKPVLVGGAYTFSISHARDLSLVAIAHGRRVGIDLEPRDRRVDDELVARRFLAPADHAHLMTLSGSERKAAFLTAWTRNEALVKMTGTGLVFPADALLPNTEDARAYTIDVGADWIATIAADGTDWRPGPIVACN
jgi:4'-phosphopantetheinyl transferase